MWDTEILHPKNHLLKQLKASYMLEAKYKTI